MFAAGFGARKDSKVAAIIGCGAQAHYQADALKARFPVTKIRVFDQDKHRARAFAAAIGEATASVVVAPTVSDAVAGADLCITCTTSKEPVLTHEMNLAGCFVAAVGADNPEKCEIEPALMARARILVDDLDQCASGADLAHALRAGALTRASVHADLAELATDHKRGREASDELVIFDSSGSGVQDVAAAWLAYRTAQAADMGTTFDLRGAAA